MLVIALVESCFLPSVSDCSGKKVAFCQVLLIALVTKVAFCKVLVIALIRKVVFCQMLVIALVKNIAFLSLGSDWNTAKVSNAIKKNA